MGLGTRVELGRPRKEPLLQKAEYFWPISLSEPHVLSCCVAWGGTARPGNATNWSSLGKGKCLCAAVSLPAKLPPSQPSCVCAAERNHPEANVLGAGSQHSMFPVTHPAGAEGAGKA